MRFRCQFDYHPRPAEADDFICPMVVEVVCSTEAFEEVVAARIAVDRLDLSRATVAGENIYEVCDADSSGWENVYAALFEPSSDPHDPDLREDFEFDEPIFNLLFVYRTVFHPSLRPWQSFIMHHVSELGGDMSATIMWKSETSLSTAELGRLGFRMIAGEDLLFLPNMLQQEYSPDEEGELFELEVPADAEDYVIQEWEREELPPAGIE